MAARLPAGVFVTTRLLPSSFAAVVDEGAGMPERADCSLPFEWNMEAFTVVALSWLRTVSGACDPGVTRVVDATCVPDVAGGQTCAMKQKRHHCGMELARSFPAVLILCALLATACVPPGGGSASRTDATPPAVSSAFTGMMQLDPGAFRRTAGERGFRTEEGGVVLDVQTEGLTGEHRQAFNRPDLVIRSFRPEFERVSVVAATPEALSAVAMLPFVRQVSPAREPSRDNTAGEY